MGDLAADYYERFWADADYNFQYALDSARRDRLPALKAVAGEFLPFGRALDFGCGNGVFTHWMFENGVAEEIDGYDVSATGVGFAQEKFAQSGLSYHHFDPAQGLPETAHDYDVVVASHVLEHVPDPVATLNDLKTRGEWLVVEVPLESVLVANTYYRLTGRDRSANPVGHLHFWTREEFEAVLREAGLEVAARHHYASAPFSPYTAGWKTGIERAALTILGVQTYGRLLATHYCVLARAKPAE
jgi:SAM-dependent methyltransferase